MAPTDTSQPPSSRFAVSVARFVRYQALRLRVRWSHWSLDARLAGGVDPASEPALILRASQLGSARHRRRLSAWVERVVRESDAAPRRTLTAAVPTVPEQIAEARASLLFLAHLLRTAEQVRPRGIAIVERLLSDGGSALYVPRARGALDLQVQIALDLLVGEDDATPEAWFSIANANAHDLVKSDL